MYLYWMIYAVVLGSAFIKRKFHMDWVLVTLAVSLHAIYFYGWIGIVLLLVIASVSTIAELLSLKTKFNIFGVTYTYNLSNSMFRSRIAIANVYPLEVTAAWVFFKYMAMYLSAVICSYFGLSSAMRIFLSAIALVSFDLLIDPVAVRHGAWQWAKGGIFFNIPWQNFLGWFVVGLCVSTVFINLEAKAGIHPLMTIPVLFTWSLFPMSFGKKLMRIDTLKGIFAVIPSTSFLLVGSAITMMQMLGIK